VIVGSSGLGGWATMGLPVKTISDVGGINENTGDNRLKELIAQAKTFDATVICNQWIKDLQKLADGTFRLTSQTGEVHDTRTLVLAIGSGIIRPIQLEVDDVELYENSSLHYAVGDFSPFANKNILIS